MFRCLSCIPCHDPGTYQSQLQLSYLPSQWLDQEESSDLNPGQSNGRRSVPKASQLLPGTQSGENPICCRVLLFVDELLRAEAAILQNVNREKEKNKDKTWLANFLQGTLYGRKTMKTETYLAPCSPTSCFLFLASHHVSSCLRNKNNSSIV